MARSSLLVGLLSMSTTSCLITSTPQFNPPQHTAPFLVADTATPDPRALVILDGANRGTTPFSANVISQDDQAGSTGLFQQVKVRLYIDYGATGPGGEPYLGAIAGNPLTAGGTLDQTMPRQASVSWPWDDPPVAPGCHTATLMVSHIFDDGPVTCPSCDDDFSQITWQVLRCDSTMMGNCDTLPVGTCPTPASSLDNTSCKLWNAANPPPVGSPPWCPETTDGGAP